MTTTWTDSALDDALRDLAGVVDPDPAGIEASLAAVRSRLAGVATPAGGPTSTDVLDLRPVPDVRPTRYGWATAALVAAVLVAAVATAVLWPRGGTDRSTPPAAAPSPTASGDLVTFRQGLLLDPVLTPVPGTQSSVLLSIAGVGDATVALPSIGTGGPAATIVYGFVCGDPRFGGDPNGPDNDVSEYTLTDNLGSASSGSCAPVRDGAAVASFGTGRDLDPRGRANVRVDVPSEDTVWKLAVVATTR